MMTTTQLLIRRLQLKSAELGLNKRQLAARADLHPNTLTRFDKPDWTPAISTLDRLEAALLHGS